MSNNSTKKTLVFSSPQKKAQIEEMLRDVAAVDRCSESMAMERALESALMPEHPNAKMWVDLLYSGGNLGKAFEDYFGYISGGINWGVKETNTREMVSFFLQVLQRGNYHLENSSDDVRYLKTQWETVTELIDGSSKLYASNLLDVLGSEKELIDPQEFVNCIMDNWEEVQKHTRTFRFLCVTARSVAKKINSTPYLRREYCRILKAESNTWK